MTTSSEDVEMKPEIETNVYDDQNSKKISWPILLDKDTPKIVTANDYAWNICYTRSSGDSGTKLFIHSECISRYIFEDTILLTVTIVQDGQKTVKEIELSKNIKKQQVHELDLVKQERGSSTEIKVTFEMTIKDIDYIGDTIGTTSDFESPGRPHDAVLIAGSRKFYVQKKYLATWSKYFDNLFFDEFVEEDQKEFTLLDIDPDEFLVLLYIIHPDILVDFNDSNVEFIMKLAEEFKMPSVLAKAGSYLMDFDHVPNLPLIDRLELSDKYKLAHLQVAVFERIHGMSADEHRAFSDANRERIRSLQPNTLKNLC